MASKFRDMFEKGGNDDSSTKPPPPTGGGGLRNRAAMFESGGAGSTAPSSNTSQSASPAGGGGGSGLRNRSAMFESGGGNSNNTTSSPTRPGPSSSSPSTSQRRGRKPPPTTSQANLILAFLSQRSSAQHTKRVAVNANIRLIQQEYRSYLAKTSGTRDMIRGRRKERNARYQENLRALIGAARNHGMEVCILEARERYLLTKRIVSAELQLLQLREQHERNKEMQKQSAEYEELSKNAPSILQPGTVENDEFRSRQHIVKFSSHCWNDSVDWFTAVMSGIMSKKEQTERVLLMTEECKERCSVAGDNRFSLWGLFAKAEITQEAELRTVLIEARNRYVSTLTQRRALVLRGTLLWGTAPESEPGDRRGLEQQQSTTYHDIWSYYISSTSRLLTADLGAREAQVRSGYGGITYQESSGRNAIVRATIQLKLQLLQGDDITDVTKEIGARKAIEWKEARVRYDLQRITNLSGLGRLLPAEEEGSRQRIVLEEFKQRLALRGRPEIRSVLVNVTEPSARRSIFMSYCRDCLNLVVYCGGLRVQAVEEEKRHHLMRLSAVELHHLASLEYLHFIELKERHLLVTTRDRLSERFRVNQRLVDRLSPVKSR